MAMAEEAESCMVPDRPSRETANCLRMVVVEGRGLGKFRRGARRAMEEE